MPAFMADQDIREHRLATCEGCELFNHSQRRCASCGCFMDVKTKLSNVTCPEDKW
mgnify:CR=1 FL=1